MSDEDKPVASPSQTVGPFFHFGLATDETLGTIATADVAGERIRLRVRVLDGDGAPVPDALVELYQPDASGVYASQARKAGSSFSGFGRLPTSADGWCVFETVRPGAIAAGRQDFQAPHINVCLLARGLLRQVYTRIYFAGDDGHDRDPLLALVPRDRRHTLMACPERVERACPERVERACPELVERARPELVERASPEPVEGARPEPVGGGSNADASVPMWDFVIRLQGEHETVFFDL